MKKFLAPALCLLAICTLAAAAPCGHWLSFTTETESPDPNHYIQLGSDDISDATVYRTKLSNITAISPILGEVRMYAGAIEPASWDFCEGQLLTIATHQDLYGNIGTTFGGDGVTTFALPDLRGRIPIGKGAGPGLTNRLLGGAIGAETHTLTVSQMPVHSHQLLNNAIEDEPNQSEPNGNVFASASIYESGTADSRVGAVTTAAAGGNQPHPIIQPSLGMNFIIYTGE